ncbi:hypothetical protein HY844_01670 [Candidatus Berkelbacteria bacterium]|nr:hypothetical protein [Candidatus Berkelbacteria bacterium]
MRSLQDEIRQAQRDLFCPICSRRFELKDINVRGGSSPTTVELSVVCQRGHFPVVLLLPVTLKEVLKAGPITDGLVKIASKKIDKVSQSLEELIK